LAISLNFPIENPINEKFIFRAITYFFKLVNPSYLLDFGGENKAAEVVVFLVFMSTIIKYLLLAYIITVEYKNKKRISCLYFFWKWIFKLQSRILCVLTASFAARTIIKASTEEFTVFGSSKVATIVIAGIIVVLEYILSFVQEWQLCEILPTINFYSSKNSKTQIIVLFQKLVLQVFEIVFKSQNSINVWAFTIPTILLSIMNNYYFYTKFPFYNFQALLYQGKCLQ